MHEQSIGFGVGLRPAHYGYFKDRLPAEVDWLELISENYMGVGGRPLANLKALLPHYPMALHGVSMSLGSRDAPSEPYLKALKALINLAQPAIVSDHLSFSHHGGQFFYDLLPLRYDQESLRRVCTNISKVQDFLDRRLLIENPSKYLDYRDQAWGEAEFLSEIVARTGCAILLDVNNLFVNAHNIGMDPGRYIEALPREAVHQFHLAGHESHGSVIIDTHSGPVRSEVWQLYQQAVRRWPAAATLIEWDAKLPTAEILIDEVSQARRHHAEALSSLIQTSGVGGPQHSQGMMSTAIGRPQASLIQRESAAKPAYRHNDSELEFFHGYLTHMHPDASDDDWSKPFRDGLQVQPRAGLAVYRNNYFGTVAEVLRQHYPLTVARLEMEPADLGQQIQQAEAAPASPFNALVMSFLESRPQASFSIDRAASDFASFLKECGAATPALAGVACYEAALLKLHLAPEPPTALLTPAQLAGLDEASWEDLRIAFSPHVFLPMPAAVAAALADVPFFKGFPHQESDSAAVIVLRDPDHDLAHREVTSLEARLFEALQAVPSPLVAIGSLPPDLTAAAFGAFMGWAACGLLRAA